MPTPVLRLALGLTLSSLAWPSLAHASTTVISSISAPAKASEADIKRAEALYKQGKAKFETAEYQEALALWKQAYEMLPDTPETRPIRHALVYNISEAEVQAYEVTKNIAHLRKAKILLQDYLTEHEALHGAGEAAVKERSGARARLKDVSDKLSLAEAAGETATPIDDTPPATEPAAQPVAAPPPAKELTPAQQEKQRIRAERRALAQAKRDRLNQIKTTPELRKQDQRYKRMIIGGSAALGGGTMFGVVTLVSVAALSLDPAPPAALPVAIVSGGLFAGGIVAGSLLLTKGLRGRKQLRQVPAPSALLVPIMLPEGGGLGIVGRF